MTQTKQHARPPILPPEIYQAVAASAERYPHAKMVVIHDPEAMANVTGISADGSIEAWHVLTPATEDGTRLLLKEEVERGNLVEDEIVFLLMAEVPPVGSIN